MRLSVSSNEWYWKWFISASNEISQLRVYEHKTNRVDLANVARVNTRCLQCCKFNLSFFVAGFVDFIVSNVSRETFDGIFHCVGKQIFYRFVCMCYFSYFTFLSNICNYWFWEYCFKNSVKVPCLFPREMG